MSMADYINSVVADYTTTELSVTPQKTMEETPNRNQIVHEADDGSISVVSLSDSVFFNVSLQWPVVANADSDIIIDFWSDTAKGNGMARTFYWQHPLDGYTYTVRFLDMPKKTTTGGMITHKSISQINLRVEGVKP